MQVSCPSCGSHHARKKGIRGNTRRYLCLDCNKWFSDKLEKVDKPLSPAERFKDGIVVPEFLKQRILLFDIETAPASAYVWGRWKQNVSQNQVLSEGYILCYSAKWLGEEKVMFDALPFYSDYKAGSENDLHVVKSLWDLLNQADIVIAHNCQDFDVPMVNSRLAFHGFRPPSPYKIVDTLKIARQNFRFPSNKLDALGEYLKLGRKTEHTGMKLWTDCIAGDREAWDLMGRYNIQDSDLLEKIYLVLRAWDRGHPNVAVYDRDTTMRCGVCGGEHLTIDENIYTNLSSFTSYQCDDCGHWNRGRISHFSKEKRKVLLANAR